MRVWLACFFVLFALAQLFDWIEHISLPMPIYILGGAFLAIASNYSRHFSFFFSSSSIEPPSALDSESTQSWEIYSHSQSNFVPSGGELPSQSLSSSSRHVGGSRIDETK